MFGWFGKRKARVAEIPPQRVVTSNWGANAAPMKGPVDDDGISRIFPKAVFEGETGEFLRSMGFSPDDPGNIAQTEETFATLDANARKALADFTEFSNAVLAGSIAIKPMFLTPESLWRGAYRNYLCSVCRLYPADPSNVFFLAANAETEQTLGLPRASTLALASVEEKAVGMVGVMAGLYEQTLRDGTPEQEARATARVHGQTLGSLLAAAQFPQHHLTAEGELFGPLMDRDYGAIIANIRQGLRAQGLI